MKSPTIECLESPPERHADRVTADMIRFLIAQRAGTNARVEAELVRSFGKRDGNPKAQAKFVERVRSVGGKTLLSVLLCPGKRGRYSLVIYDWVNGPYRHCANGATMVNIWIGIKPIDSGYLRK
jgi:hypothetical protein